MNISIVPDVGRAIAVMRNAGEWLETSGKQPSKWWQPQNLNRTFLLQYAKSEEFYVVLVDGQPAAAAVLQVGQNAQDWRAVDKNVPQKALYIHWLCVHRDFAGQNLSKIIVDFAEKLAKEQATYLLRVDTNAEETKLRALYEKLDFRLVAIEQEDYRKTALYQKNV